MSDSPTLRELLEVQQHFGLPSPALVEKDWYVVKALHAITAAAIRPFRLVFSGGTALSRAYRLTQRMSEDIDLKILSDKPMTRPGLRRLRETITTALQQAGFTFDPENPNQLEAGNSSLYTLYRLPYTPIAAGQGVLRPEIQVETAVWPLRLPPVELSVTSFVAEAFRQPVEIELMPCAALTEIVAEKFVALTRRAGSELARGGIQDTTLARHIYDLHAIRAHYDASEVAALARTVMPADAEAYGHQFPAYHEDPVRETVKAVAAMADDPTFSHMYETFRREMVYGNSAEFDTAMGNVKALAALLIDKAR